MAVVEYKITVAMNQGCVNVNAAPFNVKVFNVFICLALILQFANSFFFCSVPYQLCNLLVVQALSDFCDYNGTRTT